MIDKRYRILRLLGEGGMGSVYLAEHVGLKTHVAVKFLHLELTDDGEAIRRFEQEARIAASIRHNNIIQVFDVGFSDKGDPFLVMEYLEGECLAGLMKRTGPLDVGTACGVVEPVLLALQAAHRKGIIHRDLKPDNVFLAHQPGEGPVVKIIDFGLSKLTTSAHEMSRTQTGSILGTPAYMSPEQASGSANLDHRTDLYSLGTMLYEMLAGALPYAGNNFNEFFAKLLTEEPRNPQDVFPLFPMEADPLVRKSIRKAPGERFQSATDMLEALGDLPAWPTRFERLARISSGMTQSSFAAGDLGPAEQRIRGKGRRPLGAAELGSGQTQVGQPAGPGGSESSRRSRRTRVAGAIIATVVLVGFAGFGMRKAFAPDYAATKTKATTGWSETPPDKHEVMAAPPRPAATPTEQPELPATLEPSAASAPTDPGRNKVEEPSVEPRRVKQRTAKVVSPAPGKKPPPSTSRLRRGGRGTVMSEDFGA